MLGKTVDFQKQDLGIPIDLGIQVDYLGNPYPLKISIRSFHANGRRLTSGLPSVGH